MCGGFQYGMWVRLKCLVDVEYDGWMVFLRSRRVVDRYTGTGLTGDIFIMIFFFLGEIADGNRSRVLQ